MALFLMLLALIGRGVAFEFRSKVVNATWRKTWDWVIFFGSALPPLLWGVALANFMRGCKIDESLNYVGYFWALIKIFCVFFGGMVVLFCLKITLLTDFHRRRFVGSVRLV